MKRPNRKFLTFFFLFSLLIITNLNANQAVEAETIIDWQDSVIKITITAPLPPQIDVLPEAKIMAENTINDSVNIIIQMSMEYILLNSQTNVYERIKKNLELTSLFQGFSDLRYKTKTILTPDLLNLETASWKKALQN